MKTLFKISFLLLICCSPIVKSQEMAPPPPVEIPFFNLIEGKWVSEPYQAMGKTFTDEADQDWKLNHQYFVIDFEAKSKESNYKGKGYFTKDNDGNIKGWWFDIFGLQGLMSYSGKIEGNKMKIMGKNDVYYEEREVEVKGDVMTHNVVQKITGKDGKVQEMKYTVVYNRKMKK